MNSTFDPLVGQVLDGRYEIVAKVARGGMATVYRARDLRLTRAVAVKVMRSDMGEDDEFAAKFDREARSAAVLSHPNVVSIFDQGSSQGLPYIVMEFIEGGTLRNKISRSGALPTSRALELFEQIAAAVAAAHEAGVVHRDIKPENVMLTPRGHAKVADFGLARKVDSPQVTATGVLLGTASYLPPELVTHSRPDERSDVYSAGVVLFEMLTGQKPHTGENNYQIAYRHVNVDIERPSERLAESGHTPVEPLPDYVDCLVLGATGRDPRSRYADGRELLQAVRRARTEFAATGGRDNPALAAALLPDAPPEADTQRIGPPPARPRPSTTGLTPPTVTAEPQWRPAAATTPEPAVSPTAPSRTPTAAVTRTHSPVPPTPEDEDHWSSPRSHRTPVFPPLHISHDPVHRRRRGLLAILLVVLLTAGAGVGSWWWMSGRFTTVPTVAGLNETKATEAADANDLSVTTSTEYSETIAKGLVIRTDPGPGERLLRGGSFTLVMSLGPERYPMPTVVGEQRTDAERLLTSGRLAVGEVTEEWSETVASGVVLSATQEPGTQLKPDTPVDLVVSKGPEPIQIPNLVNGDATAAREELKKLGFEVKFSEENSTAVEKGKVLRQDPTSGTGKRGDTVTLVGSLGPVLVTIPSVAGDSVDDAKKKLEDLDLVVDVVNASSFPIALNIATGTDPGEGRSVPVGSKVTLYFA